jgi:hypothetical protein
LEVKLCSRLLGSPSKGDTSKFNPLRHDYLVVNDTSYSYTAKGNPVWSKGDLIIGNEKVDRESCEVIWADDSHDQYVEDAAKKVDANPPQYGIGPQATDCQEVASQILSDASSAYDANNTVIKPK